MLALPDALGQMANRVVDRVVILVKATLPVSWSSAGSSPTRLGLTAARGPDSAEGAVRRYAAAAAIVTADSCEQKRCVPRT
jgi:hypothetical protein